MKSKLFYSFVAGTILILLVLMFNIYGCSSSPTINYNNGKFTVCDTVLVADSPQTDKPIIDFHIIYKDGSAYYIYCYEQSLIFEY